MVQQSEQAWDALSASLLVWVLLEHPWEQQLASKLAAQLECQWAVLWVHWLEGQLALMLVVQLDHLLLGSL